MSNQTRKEIVLALSVDTQQLSQISEQIKKHFQETTIQMNIAPRADSGGYSKSAGGIWGRPGEMPPTVNVAGGADDFRQKSWYQYLQSQNALWGKQQSLSGVTGGQDPLGMAEELKRRALGAGNKLEAGVFSEAASELSKLAAEAKKFQAIIQEATRAQEGDIKALESATDAKKRLAEIEVKKTQIAQSLPEFSAGGGGGTGSLLSSLTSAAMMATIGTTVAKLLSVPGLIWGGQAAEAGMRAKNISAGLDASNYEGILRLQNIRDQSGKLELGRGISEAKHIGMWTAGLALAAAVLTAGTAIPIIAAAAPIIAAGAGLGIGIGTRKKAGVEGYEETMAQLIGIKKEDITKFETGLNTRRGLGSFQESFGASETDMAAMWGRGGAFSGARSGYRMTSGELMPGLIGLSRMGRGALTGGSANILGSLMRGTGMGGEELSGAGAAFQGVGTIGMSPEAQMARLEEVMIRANKAGFSEAPLMKEQTAYLMQIAKQTGGGFGGMGINVAEQYRNAAAVTMGGASATSLEAAQTTMDAMNTLSTQRTGIMGLANSGASEKMRQDLIGAGVNPALAFQLSNEARMAPEEYTRSEEAAAMLAQDADISVEQARTILGGLSSNKMNIAANILPRFGKGATEDAGVRNLLMVNGLAKNPAAAQKLIDTAREAARGGGAGGKGDYFSKLKARSSGFARGVDERTSTALTDLSYEPGTMDVLNQGFTGFDKNAGRSSAEEEKYKLDRSSRNFKNFDTNLTTASDKLGPFAIKVGDAVEVLGTLVNYLKSNLPGAKTPTGTAPTQKAKPTSGK